MSVFKLVEGLTYAADAGEDLSNSLNHFCKVNSSAEIVLTGADEKALGTIFEVAAEGGPVSVQFGGIAKVVASAAIAAGDRVASAASGQAKTGTTNPAGLALAAAAGVGSVIPVALVA